jgi:glycosyltransferase involved in cell wall biosynthesis
MREYYDLWDRFSSSLSPQGRIKERARRTLVRAADTYFLKHHVTRLFTISAGVRDRVARWNRLPATVLHPPPPQRPYRCDTYGDYLFAASRLTPLKRMDLAVRALAEPAARQVRLVIGGEGEEMDSLVRLSRDLGVDGRVTFTGRLTEEALVDHLARCRAVVFVPHDEDYGFVTVEAFAAGKAVITCTDSGGPLELVIDDRNGWVVSPTAGDLARAMAETADSPTSAERLGRQGLEDIAALTWANVVQQLVIV